MPIKNPKTLDQLIDFFNENPPVFGWKPRYEELIIFAERLEQELAERDKLIEQMREAFERINGAAWRIKLAQGNSTCSCESLNAADIIAWSSEYRKAALSAAERGE